VKPIPSPHDQEIIELLKRLGTLKAEYPPELLSARRADFVAQINQRASSGATNGAFPSEEKVIELLQGLRPLAAEYPAELLAARRAAFLVQIEEYNRVGVQKESASEDRLVELLETLRPVTAEYPPELLAARRAAFLAQIEQHQRLVVQEDGLPFQNGKVYSLLERLKSSEVAYPWKLWSGRRSAFVAQIRQGKTSVLDAVRSAVQNLLHSPKNVFSAPATAHFRRVSLVMAGMLLAAFLGSWLYGNRQPLLVLLAPSPSQGQPDSTSPVAVVNTPGETAKVICKPGYLPPLCLAKEFDKSQDLTSPGNGSARPAVAKDTIPGYSRIHQPAYVNDGLYGSGASWISNSAYSWIKIDLGEVRTINTITFGRDRLGNYNDGDPGQFIISVALSDDVYANGNSSNDSIEYTEVYNSKETGFNGIVSGPETIEANFKPIKARFVKITFENERTAVDEIEVFMVQPSGLAMNPTQRPRDTLVAATFTPVPTKTLLPSKTSTAIPTRTLAPTNTATLRPTFTPRPTNTFVPTDTPVPPTNTPIPPTDTPEPTDTSVPPTDTPEPPTDTPEPPTDTSEPPEDTSEPPTATAEPQLLVTETSEVVPGP
jgi:hypothetical protein